MFYKFYVKAFIRCTFSLRIGLCTFVHFKLQPLKILELKAL